MVRKEAADMPRRARRLSLKQYAAHRGCSLSSVHKALMEGRLTEWSAVQDPSTGRWNIDPRRADLEWRENTDPYRGGVGGGAGGR
jgi:hypothetical protein